MANVADVEECRVEHDLYLEARVSIQAKRHCYEACPPEQKDWAISDHTRLLGIESKVKGADLCLDDRYVKILSILYKHTVEEKWTECEKGNDEASFYELAGVSFFIFVSDRNCHTDKHLAANVDLDFDGSQQDVPDENTVEKLCLYPIVEFGGFRATFTTESQK